MSREQPTEERIQRLPKWAQEHIARLTESLERAERRFSTLKMELGKRDAGLTPILVRTFEGPNFGLGKDDQIDYRLAVPGPRGNVVRVVLSQGGKSLDISGDRAILLSPLASNRIQVTLDDD